ncbi:hypothetical protein BLMD_05580 [Bacillus paralicheniformis]|nr:hypothetical protein BLMD_05580 [Bacillus paralicheniformis]OPF70363.1 hypothetical protein BVF99_20255 [Bacillus paralicheniformis]TWK43136.1 hypothetical protein CHCC20347_1956 [Bacillus paralicheniformis]TWN35663.1 hypothetical protein CHCC14523_2065 [Bacillus paralicheniformis]
MMRGRTFDRPLLKSLFYNQQRNLRFCRYLVADVAWLLHCFNELTSPVTGIFQLWGEKHLPQLPLAQCFVQITASLSAGPTELFPELVLIYLDDECTEPQPSEGCDRISGFGAAGRADDAKQN